ncbi:MAG: TIGR03960 family B12-binding radical SAM protein [Fibrobacter sp.]|jgi:radical SAM family uncharacterized protein/radical SAM-linked protein|nr:TIGR03960 family B12-binding radical SAM protein [Fibrobacter sp.]
MHNLKDIINSRLLPYVSRPLRYTGAELNIIRKDLSEITVHGVICFPDLYDIGMSHNGLQILYHLVNREKNWALSRSFSPWADSEEVMRREGIPLYTLEYMSKVRDADWIGFSLQYELQYTNIVNMIDLAGLEVYSRDRSDGDPLIIAGGPCAGNPEPLSRFIDAFAIGDGEETVIALCRVLEREKIAGSSREAKLKAISEIPGIYVPSLYSEEKSGKFTVAAGKRVTAAKVPVLCREYYPLKPLVPLIETVHSRLAVEVMRGCTRGCRFCSAGIYYRPVRERSPGEIYLQIRDGVESTGWRDVGLLSLSTADYTCLSGLLEAATELKEKYHISIALPSTRVDALTKEQFEQLGRVSASSSLTIAPEAGSARLRRVINKDFTDEAIFSTVEKLLSGNVQTLKLYFMIGLPTERDEDIEAIIQMVTKISGMVRARQRRRMIHVSISPFSPKPHTPFCREKMEDTGSLGRKGAHIKAVLRKLRNVKVSYRNPQVTMLETVMARGDRRVSDLIFQAWRKGARFDGWDECFDIQRWIDAASELNIDLNTYLDEIPEKQELPWSVVSTGVSESYLMEERRRALLEMPTEDCRTGKCTSCGVCVNGIRREIPDEKSFILYSRSRTSVTQKKETKLFQYRFLYRKGEQVRYLGHLDMVSVIQRAFLAAGVPVAFSNGFNPHPRMSFGPPLPSGIIGEREAFDTVMTGMLSSDSLIVNKWLPDDLKVIGFRELPEWTPSLNSSISSALYRFTPYQEMEEGDIEERIGQLLSLDTAEVEIKKGGEVRRKDIRPGIIELKSTGGGFEALLSMISTNSCKPSELIKGLFPQMELADFKVIREQCFSGREPVGWQV